MPLICTKKRQKGWESGEAKELWSPQIGIIKDDSSFDLNFKEEKGLMIWERIKSPLE